MTRQCVYVFFLLASFGRASPPTSVEVNSRRGEQVYHSQSCPICHKTEVDPAKPGPNLVRRLDRDFTAASLTSRIWNHAPGMWEEARKSPDLTSHMSEADVADLFGFFYSVRFFEKPGDAGRGKRVFKEKECAGCHALESGGGPGKPVKQWAALIDPVDMVQRMWIHVEDVATATESHMKWRELTAQDLSDILVYLQNMPATKPDKLKFELPVGKYGAELIQTKGCTECHYGAKALERTLWKKTLTEAAVDMWNHAPHMPHRISHVTADEMREIISYAWSQDFFTPRGDPNHGQKVFQSKCNGSCHGLSALTPMIRARTSDYTAMSIVSAVWAHDAKPFTAITAHERPWPTLTPSEMANVIAYLNSLRKVEGRDY